MPDQLLVRITAETHGVAIDLAYAGPDNFTGAPVYARAACLLRPEAEARLARAVGLAARQGYGVLIFDAFRPAEAQWRLWNHTPDPEFLAEPWRGSMHSRGVAVDLTLTDAAGRALDMGTAFDAFTPRSHHGDTGIPAAAQRNRSILLGLMTAAGWDFNPNEWWHYQLPGGRRFPLLSDSALRPGLL